MHKQTNTAASTPALDLVELLTEFFKLPDWPRRTAILGGVAAVLSLASVLPGLFGAFGSIFGPIFFCGLFIAWLVACVLFALYAMYLNGYEIDLIKADTVMSVKPNDRYGERIMLGLKLIVMNFIYILPSILCYLGFAAMVFVFIFMVAGAGAQRESGLTLILVAVGMLVMIVAILLLAVAFVYSLFVGFFIRPAQIYLFLKTGSIVEAIRPGKIWEFILANKKELLINGLIFYLVMMGYSFALGFAANTFYLCIGFILYPLVVAIGQVYITHLDAALMAKVFKGKL